MSRQRNYKLHFSWAVKESLIFFKEAFFLNFYPTLTSDVNHVIFCNERAYLLCSWGRKAYVVKWKCLQETQAHLSVSKKLDSGSTPRTKGNTTTFYSSKFHSQTGSKAVDCLKQNSLSNVQAIIVHRFYSLHNLQPSCSFVKGTVTPKKSHISQPLMQCAHVTVFFWLICCEAKAVQHSSVCQLMLLVWFNLNMK